APAARNTNNNNRARACCFLAGTQVLMGDGIRKNIEEVTVGNTVMGYDGTKTVPVKVTELIAPVRDHFYKVGFADDSALQMTGDHPLFTRQGWKAISLEDNRYIRNGVPVTQLSTGDEVLTSGGRYVAVRTMERIAGSVQTYTFAVDRMHNYFANGFLAHNYACDEEGPTPASTRNDLKDQQSQQQQDQKKLNDRQAELNAERNRIEKARVALLASQAAALENERQSTIARERAQQAAEAQLARDVAKLAQDAVKLAADRAAAADKAVKLAYDMSVEAAKNTTPASFKAAAEEAKQAAIAALDAAKAMNDSLAETKKTVDAIADTLNGSTNPNKKAAIAALQESAQSLTNAAKTVTAASLLASGAGDSLTHGLKITDKQAAQAAGLSLYILQKYKEMQALGGNWAKINAEWTAEFFGMNVKDLKKAGDINLDKVAANLNKNQGTLLSAMQNYGGVDAAVYGAVLVGMNVMTGSMTANHFEVASFAATDAAVTKYQGQLAVAAQQVADLKATVNSVFNPLLNDTTLSDIQKMQAYNAIAATNAVTLKAGIGVLIDPSKFTAGNLVFNKDGTMNFVAINATYIDNKQKAAFAGTFTGAYLGAGKLNGNIAIADPSKAVLDVTVEPKGNPGPASDSTAQTVAEMVFSGSTVHLTNILQLGIKDGVAKQIANGDIATNGSVMANGEKISGGNAMLRDGGFVAAAQKSDGTWTAGGYLTTEIADPKNAGTFLTKAYSANGFEGYVSAAVTNALNASIPSTIIGTAREALLAQRQTIQAILANANSLAAAQPGKSAVSFDLSTIDWQFVQFNADGVLTFADGAVDCTYFDQKNTAAKNAGSFVGTYGAGGFDGVIKMNVPSEAAADVAAAAQPKPNDNKDKTQGPASTANTIAVGTTNRDGTFHLTGIVQLAISGYAAKGLGNGDMLLGGSVYNGQTIQGGILGGVQIAGNSFISVVRGPDGTYAAGGIATVQSMVAGSKGTALTVNRIYDQNGFVNANFDLAKKVTGEQFTINAADLPNMGDVGGVHLVFTVNADGKLAFAGTGKTYPIANGTVSFTPDSSIIIDGSNITIFGTMNINTQFVDAMGRTVKVNDIRTFGTAARAADMEYGKPGAVAQPVVFKNGQIISGVVDSLRTTQTFLSSTMFINEVAITKADNKGSSTHYDITLIDGKTDTGKLNIHGVYTAAEIASVYNSISLLGTDGFNSIRSVSGGIEVNLTDVGKQVLAAAVGVNASTVAGAFIITAQSPITSFAAIYAAMQTVAGVKLPAGLAMTVDKVNNAVTIDSTHVMDAKTGIVYEINPVGGYNVFGVTDAKGNIYTIKNGVISNQADAAMTTSLQRFVDRTKYQLEKFGMTGRGEWTAAFDLVTNLSTFLNPAAIGGFADVQATNATITGIMNNQNLSATEKAIQSAWVASMATGQSVNIQAWAMTGASLFTGALQTAIDNGVQFVKSFLSTAASGIDTLGKLFRGVLVDSLTGKLDNSNPFSISTLAVTIATGGTPVLRSGWSESSLDNIGSLLALGYNVQVYGGLGATGGQSVTLAPSAYGAVRALQNSG
ncbi:MAG: Hint domain-containing protein, partial [Elusimicrobiota bacterium]